MKCKNCEKNEYDDFPNSNYIGCYKCYKKGKKRKSTHFIDQYPTI
jgi:protein-arginine kinase activator protein McsA